MGTQCDEDFYDFLNASEDDNEGIEDEKFTNYTETQP